MRGLAPFINTLKNDAIDKANFRFVYIAEAHATDEWPVTSARFNESRGINYMNYIKM